MKRFLAICLLVFAAAAVCRAQDISPNMTVKDLSGNPVLMKDVLKDDVVVVSFWATWCKPCQNELDALAEIEDTWADRLRVVAISIDDARSVARVRSTVKAKMWPYEVYTDENSELAKSLNISSIPFVMIVDDGKTVYSHTGYTPGSERLLVEKALSFIKRSAIPEGLSSIPAVSRYLLLPILSIVLLTRGSEMSPQNAIRALVTSVLTAKPKRMICITGITITIRTVLISLNMCRNSFLTEAQNSFIVIPPFPPFRPLS